MNIAALQYSLKDRAYDVFVAGCSPPHCNGCHNETLHSFKCTAPIEHGWAICLMETHASFVDRIRIMGGEPLDQNLSELLSFIAAIRERCGAKDVWIFTRYLPEELNAEQKEVLKHVQYSKHGRYIQGDMGYVCERTNLSLASRNQFVLCHK